MYRNFPFLQCPTVAKAMSDDCNEAYGRQSPDIFFAKEENNSKTKAIHIEQIVFTNCYAVI